MTSNTIWFKVDRSNEAIMAYCLQLSETPSSKYDYVEATQDELIYLSALEDAVFAPGMVATLSDLYEHRSRVAAAKKAKAAAPTKPAYKAMQQPHKSGDKTSKTNSKASNDNAKATLIAALRKHRSNK